MENSFVSAQYSDTGEYYEGTDSYGYYNELGEYIYYENTETEHQQSEIEVHTDQGIIKYKEVLINNQLFLVDAEGRLLNENKLQGVSFEVFVSSI